MSQNKIMDFIEKAARESLEREAKERGISPEELEREHKEEQQKRDAEFRVKHERESIEKARVFKEKTEALGKKLGLGVPAVPAEIVMLRELSERSCGTGTDYRSVVHIRVLEDFQNGRLHRKAGELLCGRRGRFDTHNVEPDKEHTCKRCVEITARLKG